MPRSRATCQLLNLINLKRDAEKKPDLEEQARLTRQWRKRMARVEVADAARAFRPELKVLFVTGYAEKASVANGYLESGMQVIEKPFAVADFGNKVREMIES
jgi:CheY-like chemotaxis protein